MPRKKKEQSPNYGPQEDLPSEQTQAAMSVVSMRMLAAEFFDAGVIILTREDEGQTRLIHTKFGNQFAIRGMLDTYMDEHVCPELNIDNGEDRESWKESS